MEAPGGRGGIAPAVFNLGTRREGVSKVRYGSHEYLKLLPEVFLKLCIFTFYLLLYI
jgi:hypothetical protein